MYGDLEFETGGGRRLVVPQSAVLNSGDRQVVFLDRGNGAYEPREVKIGAQLGDRVEILCGPQSGRAHRHLRQLPDRFGKPAQMINRIIEISAHNRFLVFLFVAAAALAGWWSMQTIPLDAIPDLSDTQVIVYSRWDRSPDIIEDQVTYPIVTAMLGAPKVKDVRGFSDFGYSYVYIIFEEGTDIYWARSRTLEYLSKILPRLPQGVQTELGPDATGVGWVFQYALVDTSRPPRPGRAALLPGLVPALPAAGRAGRRGSGAARRLRAAVSGQRRSQPPGRLRRSDLESGRGGARRQQRRGRAAGGIHRPRVHGARPRLCADHRRPGEHRARAPARRAFPSWCATSAP